MEDIDLSISSPTTVYTVQAFVSGIVKLSTKTMTFELCLDDSTCSKVVRPSKTFLCSILKLDVSVSEKELKKKCRDQKGVLQKKWAETNGLIDLIVTPENELEIIRDRKINHVDASNLFDKHFERVEKVGEHTGSDYKRKSSKEWENGKEKKSRGREYG